MQLTIYLVAQNRYFIYFWCMVFELSAVEYVFTGCYAIFSLICVLLLWHSWLSDTYSKDKELYNKRLDGRSCFSEFTIVYFRPK